jgi:hypothetical protein
MEHWNIGGVVVSATTVHVRVVGERSSALEEERHCPTTGPARLKIIRHYNQLELSYLRDDGIHEGGQVRRALIDSSKN